jgi:general nucleoside transport system ATP-binding protein
VLVETSIDESFEAYGRQIDEAPPVLRAAHISKSYGPVEANVDVTLDVRSSEIHAVLGENGAGKSTLMRILYGMEAPDQGFIELFGERRTFGSPRDAIDAGVGMVHQHFTLVPTLTVLENVILGRRIAGRGVLRLSRARRLVKGLAEHYRLSVDLDATVSHLSVGEQQRVEILKALVRGAKALILDEPTAVLTPQEVSELSITLREQARAGLAIFIVTHKLSEVMDLAHRVSVMRRGRLAGTWLVGETTSDELVTHMIGRSRQAEPARTQGIFGAAILYIRNVHALSDRDRKALNGVNLTVRAGEVVGIAGVEGNGQQELTETIMGLRPVTAGEIVIDGANVLDKTTSDILTLGVAHVPQDRHRDGLVLDFSVAENSILIEHREPEFRERGLIARTKMKRFAAKLVKEFAIRCGGIDEPTRTLSGGNQQKLVLGRELARKPKLLIAAQPTRGLDVGAIDYVHTQIIERRNAGTAVMLVSTELDEIFALSDRIAVLREGRIACILERAEATVERIGAMMLGSGSSADGVTK